MDSAIGVIDSGIGGLTVVDEIMKQLPKEKVIYIGDTLRCPYGSKSREEVERNVWEIVDIIIDMDIKLLVVACNTATAFVFGQLKERLDIPVIGVINPGSRAAIKVTANKKIGIIGTQGTIESNAYSSTLKGIDPTLAVYPLACPLFAPMIESGKTQGADVERIVRDTLSPLTDTEIDTLVLGCTHYPLITEIIQNVVGQKVTIVSSSEETVQEIGAVLEINNLLNFTGRHNQGHEFYVTGDLDMFANATRNMFMRHLNDIKKIEIKEEAVNS